jgi:UDP:flavonoid glycosyltransferase YjiC (YdhE family)
VRVLFVAAPMVGHVLPMMSLARAFTDAGHDVVVATAADGVQAATRVGVPAQDVAPGLSMSRIGLGALLHHPGPVVRMARGDEGTDGVGVLFEGVNEGMADGIRDLAERWQPNLVLHEGLMPTGALAAARHGIPSVLVDSLVYDGGALFRAVSRRIGAVVRRFGLVAIAAPADVVTVAPPSLVGSRAGRPMRFVPPDSSGGGSSDLTTPSSRPTVVVTRSTVADPRRDRLMTTVVEAAVGADLDVVLVRPDRWVTRRSLPGNVRTTDWLPFAEVFPTVAGVVHHGGSGTVLTALAAGVPQLVVPGAGDRALHARLLAERGAGLRVPLDRLNTAALDRLVGDPALRSAAQEVAAEIAAMPHPRELVLPLTELAGQSAAS